MSKDSKPSTQAPGSIEPADATSATPGGRVWRCGDNLDTDALAPGQYMKYGIEEIARHCLESLQPEFASQVRAGYVVVAGRNCGTGSSREQAPQALKHLGVAALVAKSFAGLFYRNAINLGLPAVVCAEADRIQAGDRISVDARAGLIHNHTRGEQLRCEAIPAHLLQLLDDGGLLSHLERRLAGRTSNHPAAVSSHE
jgi:3-isopropylmalate/(R)-2-methylmalate dehydratase small subunit